MTTTVCFKKARRHLCKRRLRTTVAEIKVRVRRIDRRKNKELLKINGADYDNHAVMLFAIRQDIV